MEMCEDWLAEGPMDTVLLNPEKRVPLPDRMKRFNASLKKAGLYIDVMTEGRQVIPFLA